MSKSAIQNQPHPKAALVQDNEGNTPANLAMIAAGEDWDGWPSKAALKLSELEPAVRQIKKQHAHARTHTHTHAHTRTHTHTLKTNPKALPIANNLGNTALHSAAMNAHASVLEPPQIHFLRCSYLFIQRSKTFCGASPGIQEMKNNEGDLAIHM